jgi:pimeloyl-ACP methyl ester carboxylesterase
MSERDCDDDQAQHCLVGGMRARFRRSGQDPTLLLLHGSRSSLDSFDEAARALAPGFDVVRPDLPGFGYTGPRPDRDYPIETFVGFVHQFVLARNPLARQVLRRLSARAATAHNLRRVVGPTVQVPESMIDRVHEVMSLPGNRDAFIDFARIDQKDNSAAISKITVPTLILRGSDIDGQHFGRDISDSTEIVLDGVGHLMPEEAAKDVADRVESSDDQGLSRQLTEPSSWWDSTPPIISSAPPWALLSPWPTPPKRPPCRRR